MSTPKPQIFLSYSHQDKEIVYQLYDALVVRGLNVWIDIEGVSIGKWKPEIKHAIAQSKYFIFCMSEAALEGISQYPTSVQGEELEYAISIAEAQAARQFAIIPVQLEECEHGDHRLSIWNQFTLYREWDREIGKLSKQLGETVLEGKTIPSSLQEQINKYAKKIGKRYNRIKIMGMNRPVSLRDLYVRINILEDLTEQMRLHPNELTEAQQLAWAHEGFGKPRETLNGLDTVNKLSKFVVLGKPGAGKTTFLKRCVLYALDDHLKDKRIPIMIVLRRFIENIPFKNNWAPGEKLLEFILHEFDIKDIETKELFVTQVLKKGKALILLDGLDEVNKENSATVIREIQSFSDKFDENQFIISCRIAAYNTLFEAFTDVEMADFNNEQIELFIKNWFKDQPKKGEACWKELNNWKAIYELASVPLLLTLLCIAFDETFHFPSSRSELYREAIDALLKTWDSKRGIRRSGIYKKLPLKQKESLLSRLASEAFENEVILLPEKQLVQQIGEFIRHLPEVQEKDIEPDSYLILRVSVVQHGIITPRAERIYSFSHLTFQEYFTAKYIVDNARKGSLEGLVQNHLGKPHWREVFLLTAEMLDDASDFLQLIKTAIDEEAKTKKVAKTLRLAQQIIKSKSNFPHSLSRAVALFYILNYQGLDPKSDENLKYLVKDPSFDPKRAPALERVLALTNILARSLADFLSFDLANALNRGLAISLASAFDRALDQEDFTDNLEQDITIDLDEDTGDTLAREIANGIDRDLALETYLFNSRILLDCLQTECYVSTEVREKILNELLAPPT